MVKDIGPRQAEILILGDKFYTARYIVARLAEVAIWALISWFAYLSISALAGENTRLVVRGLMDSAFSCTVAFSFGIGGTYIALRQRKLKGDTVERLQARIRQLESIIDPERSSAALTERGDTKEQR